MKKLLVLSFLFFMGYGTYACTTFLINKNGHLVFGRNYDWITGNGLVCTNHRGLAKTSYKTSDGETISWISKYGSITFNQYGKEFPTGGMNEKGLVVELMWLDGTRYPEPDSRPAVSVLQWIQYHLDNCGTIEELIAQDKHIRIASKGTTPLHYLVADASGKAAVIEFLDGKMKVYTGKDLPFPVLTNDTYASSISYSQPHLASSASNSKVFINNSIDRFAKACQMVKEFQKSGNTPPVDYSFEILNTVAQGSHTKWSIVYDIINRKIYFKSHGYNQIKQVAFSAFDLSCKVKPVQFDINQALTGDVSRLFTPISTDINRKSLAKSFDDSKSQIDVNPETIHKLGAYAAQITCSPAAR